MIDEATTDRGVNARDETDLELRADTVGGRNQHRLRHVWKSTVEHAAKAADFGERALVKRRAREFLDSVGCARRGVDVNAGVSVGNGFGHVFQKLRNCGIAELRDSRGINATRS